MFTKTKGFFKKALSAVLSATCIMSGMAFAGTIAATTPIEAAAAGSGAATFSWDNATVYFLLTDRFCNGDTSNDNAYGRMKTVAGDNRATFHGGDFAGITKKINEGYFNDLGVTAIWMTAPYEQLNGYILGDNFAHYSYHGYYVTDYTEPDDAYGTKEEFKTLVDTAHEHGIRIIMDVVMNHAGYNNMIDMNDYNYGTLLDGWKTVYDAGDLANYHKKIDYETSATDWGRWWGTDWVRSGLPGYSEDGGGSELTQCLTGLPDFRTESTKQVGIPQFLQTKWTKEGTLSEKMAKYGSSNTVTGYISTWLAEWVETYGIDGFRCDTAKHVEQGSWKQLKDKCVAALRKWKQANPTKKLDDLDFWMTGECWNWTLGGSSGASDPYFSQGGFDSMINFETQGGGMVAQGTVAGTYANYASKINSSDSFNGLSYLSSHDSTLARPSDMYSLGSAFLLLPGAVQIYYGDETARPFVQGIPNDGNGGAGHSLRSDMPWDSLNKDLVAHWGKVGNFRKNHVSVGAGDNVALTASSGVAFGRTYSKNSVSDKIAGVIYASAGTEVSVDVSAIWADGTTLENYYDETTAVVSGGKVTFSAGAHGTILIQEPEGERGKVTVTHIDQDSGKTIKTETLSGLVGTTYEVSPLSQDGFKLDKTVGKTSGTFAKTDAEVTFYYSFDDVNYAYIVVKHVDAATGTEIADSTTEVAKVGSSYSATPVEVKNYEVDLTKSTNVSGTVKVGTTTATFKYNYVEPTNLKVHYYNANGWATVYMYAYQGDGATATKLLGAWPGKAMTDEGNGWFVCEVPDADSAKVLFTASATGPQEPAKDVPGYEVSGEVYMKNGTPQTVSKVVVMYTDTNGKTLGTETLKGMSGDSYTTTAKTFSGYTLKTTPSNATGKFAATTTTVTYVYESDEPEPEALVNNSKLSPTTIKVGASATITGVAAGGTPSYTYKYEAKSSSASSYTTLKDYSSSTSYKYTPSAAGTYSIKVTVKDSAGKTAAKTLSLTVEKDTTLTNKSTISATSITLGKSVTVTGAATGGTTPYQYQVAYKKASTSSYTVTQAYSTNTKVTIKPGAAVDYNVRVIVKDKAGKTATKTFTVKVSPAPLTNNSKVSATSVAVGKSITITGAATGGTAPYQFASSYKLSSASSYTSIRSYSTTKTMTFTPKKSGTYTILVKVKDNVGTVVSKTFTVKATPAPLTNKCTVSATSITLGKSITVTCAATGGTTPYQYSAYYKKTSASSYTTLKSLSSVSSIAFKPTSTGTYELKVYVKDAKGTTASKAFTITVKAAELVNKTTVAATTATLGTSIKITGAATGGTTPYQYAAYYKKSGADSFTCFKKYSTTSSYSFKAPSVGTYTLRLKVKDAANQVANKDVTVKITSASSTTLENNSFLSASSIKLGSKVTVTGKPSGGTSPYQYAISYKKASSDTFTTVQNYSTNRIVEIKPSAATKYIIRVKIKDAKGNMKGKDLTLTVTK